MKKFFLISIFTLAKTCFAWAQEKGLDTIRNVEFYKDFQSAMPVEEDSTFLPWTFACIGLFFIACVGCVVIWYYGKVKQAQLEQLLAESNTQLAMQKFQSNSYAYILNSTVFPMSLVGEDGKIAWCNQAYYDIFGKNNKTFDIFEGAAQDIDKESIRNSKVAQSYYVKMKTEKGKVVGFKRTLIPLPGDPNGSKNFAVVENYLEA